MFKINKFELLTVLFLGKATLLFQNIHYQIFQMKKIQIFSFGVVQKHQSNIYRNQKKFMGL